MNYFRNQKKKTLNQIHQTIQENDPIEKSKLISKIEIEMGSSKDKAEEYLDTLQNADKIKLEDGKYMEA